jgi:hypothetical protein
LSEETDRSGETGGGGSGNLLGFTQPQDWVVALGAQQHFALRPQGCALTAEQRLVNGDATALENAMAAISVTAVATISFRPRRNILHLSETRTTSASIICH